MEHSLYFYEKKSMLTLLLLDMKILTTLTLPPFQLRANDRAEKNVQSFQCLLDVQIDLNLS